MALKKNTETKTTPANVIEVTRAKEFDNVVLFDMKVNGVTIYGCTYKTLTRKDNGEEFVKIGFPQKKGKDDKYYNHAFVKLSDDDIRTIEEQLNALV